MFEIKLVRLIQSNLFPFFLFDLLSFRVMCWLFLEALSLVSSVTTQINLAIGDIYQYAVLKRKRDCTLSFNHARYLIGVQSNVH